MMKNHVQKLCRIFFLTTLFVLGPQLFAQKTVTGVVMDGSMNEPLIGGTVAVKNGKTGTITDINGKFSISVSEKDILVFSYIGLEKQEIEVGEKTTINVTLKASSVQLNEVVAIGYGSVKKSDLTGAVSMVSTKDLTKNPSSNAAQALQGKAPGVLVTQSGKPGGGTTIRVRGVGSINKSADPVYILDGVMVSNIDNIQSQDIENLQVLKDASAAAIYGANGSNGVIIINTKRGKTGKPQVNLNTYVGISLAPQKYDIMNAQEYSDFYLSTKYNGYGTGQTRLNNNNEVIANTAYALSPEFRQKYYGTGWQTGTDWQDLIFKTGFSQNYNFSVAGGGENSNFNISLGYVKDDGNVIKSNAERYNIRANSDFKLSKYVKVGENLSVYYKTSEDPIMIQSSIWDLNASPLMRINNSYYKGGFESPQTMYWEDLNGDLHTGIAPSGTYSYSNTLGNDKPNPYAAPSLGSNKGYGLGTNASVYLQIDFANWLMYKLTPSAEIVTTRSKYWLPQFEGNRSPNQASLEEKYSEEVNLNLEQQLLFKKTFNDIHNVQATAVYQVRSGVRNLADVTVNGFDFEQLNTLSNGGTDSKSIKGYTYDSRMLSYLGRVMYDYSGKYFVTASFRSDGIHLFAPGYRRGNFVSGSLAWKVNEDFFKNVKEIDALKLRLGWGQTGNSNIGEAFQYLDKISEATNFSPVFGDDQHIARAQYVFYGLASKKIRWESAEMYNLGVDATLLNGKLQFTGEYYIKNNSDLLVAIPISSSFGRQDGNPWYNAGKIQNRGFELSLQWREKIRQFNYGIISSLTTIKNEVMELPVSDITSGNNRTKVGHSIGALYGYAADGIIQIDDFTGGFDPVTNSYTGYKYATHLNKVPQPGDVKFKDLNGDGNVDALDKTIIGKTIPSFTYTIGFDCSYKNFDLNVFLFGVSDFQIYNQQRASMSSINSQDMDHNKLNEWINNYWTPENPTNEYVRVDFGNKNVNDQISSFWIENGSFLRIKDVQMGYTLPAKICKTMGVGSLRLYANASNLYCITAYKGRDPEGFVSSDPLASGTDNGNYSLPRTFTFGLQIGF